MADAPSMPAGSHEMQGFSSNLDPPHSSPQTAPSVTPYLGLRARLSQVWINRWTILLLLVLARSLIALRDINGDLASAKREALSACTTVEDMGSTMASMPHYMSSGVNELSAAGIEKAVNGLYQMASMSITGVEEIVLFVINLMTSTYLCLITLAVGSSLHAVIAVLEDANDKLKGIVGPLGNDMANAIEGFDKSLEDINKTLSSASILGKSIHLPSSLDLSPNLDKLRNLQLPDGLDADLQKLNNSIPSFAQVQNFTNTAIRFPFELLKKEVNESLGTYTFNRSLFPTPEKQQLSFCSNNNGINDFFNGLADLLSTAKKIFIAGLIGAAIIACIPMGYREVRRWRTQQERAKLVGTNKYDSMDVVYIVSRPYTATFGINISSKIYSIRRQSLVRWVVAYATTEAALFVLALGIAGLFTCACHVILLKSIEKQVPNLSEQVGQFADQVVGRLNNASESWALATNQVISQKSDDINKDMFGWVNVSVNAINDTLNVFVNETMGVLHDAFGGTPLEDPIKEVFNCLIGLKIQGIQKALTWVEDHAHVNFPTLPNDTFSVGAVASLAEGNDSSFLASPGDVASDKISSTVTRVVNKLYEDIKTEAIISTIVLGIWFFILFIAICRALILWCGRDKTAAQSVGAPDLTTVEHSKPHSSASFDFRSNDQDRYKEFQDIPLDNVRGPPDAAPRYSRENPFGDGPFGDDKAANYGFAGQRNDNELARTTTGVQSHRASHWPADRKY